MNRMLSPDRADPFAKLAAGGNKTNDSKKAKGDGMLPAKRSYYDIMSEQSLENEKADVYHKIAKKQEEEKKNNDQQDRMKRQKLKDETSTNASVTIKSHI